MNHQEAQLLSEAVTLTIRIRDNLKETINDLHTPWWKRFFLKKKKEANNEHTEESQRSIKTT